MPSDGRTTAAIDPKLSRSATINDVDFESRGAEHSQIRITSLSQAL